MPRPTAAQLAYGSATVIVSTIAMLLLSQTRTGVGVAVITAAALFLGLLVALTAAMPKRTARRVRTNPATVPAEQAGAPAARVPEPRPAEQPAHSVHR
ncbi:hypothetical protein ACM614_13745 [Streptomyces sp. 12297]|uniref:hypothetical protein n=1 Tax=Streptomyces sp. NBC_00239 TaxID=2903640 RepID=UPI002E295C1F|nr:hypothetical protein [Streptomyces sp. NBC_00239]